MICKTYELNTLKSYKYKEITPTLFKKIGYYTDLENVNR